MAQIYLTGYDGTADLTTAHNANLKTWSLQHSKAVADITGFNDAAHRRRLGLQDCVGSCGGTMIANTTNNRPGVQTNNAATAGWSRDGVAITFGASSNSTVCSYAMTAIVSGINQNVTKDGDSAITFDVQLASGSAPTETWDET